MSKPSDPTDQLSLKPKKGGRWSHLLKEFPGSEDKAEIKKEPKETPSQPELQESEEQPTTEKIFSVSEINKAIKGSLESQFSYLWLQGEISNFKAHTSGHFYFSLKDERAQISGVMFRGFNNKLKFMPESGMEVLVRGKITVYEPRGNYQMFVEHMEPVGAGALQKAFEQLKAKLQGEGLFAKEAKKELPSHPRKVAVVTSPTGAAIRDILNVLQRRSRRVEVTVIPARVQGQTAATEIAKAIELANQVGDFDVMIVGRVGGSIEDLWCFNEENVARAIFASEIPIISAVGHEIDFTISDFVADMRAPTPSAAAELVAESEEQLRQRLSFSFKALTTLVYQAIREQKQQIGILQKSLRDPRQFLRDCMLRCDELLTRLNKAVLGKLSTQRLVVQSKSNKLPTGTQLLAGYKSKLAYMTGMLDSLSPLQVVGRGYAIVKKENKVIKSIKQVKAQDSISIQMSDGFIEANVKNTKGGKK